MTVREQQHVSGLFDKHEKDAARVQLVIQEEKERQRQRLQAQLAQKKQNNNNLEHHVEINRQKEEKEVVAQALREANVQLDRLKNQLDTQLKRHENMDNELQKTRDILQAAQRDREQVLKELDALRQEKNLPNSTVEVALRAERDALLEEVSRLRRQVAMTGKS